MNRAERQAEARTKAKRRDVPTEELAHPLFYLGQERAFAPGIVKVWPKVFYMPRRCPHGRAVLLTHEQVANELRRLGYTVTAPTMDEAGSTPRVPRMDGSQVIGSAPCTSLSSSQDTNRGPR